MIVRYGLFVEHAVSCRKKFKIIIAPTYDDDSRAKIALWNHSLVNTINQSYDLDVR